jgi:hypothetical protein
LAKILFSELCTPGSLKASELYSMTREVYRGKAMGQAVEDKLFRNFKEG